MFYHSNCDKHMLKPLLAQRRRKLPSSKIMGESTQWARISKDTRGEKNNLKMYIKLFLIMQIQSIVQNMMKLYLYK